MRKIVYLFLSGTLTCLSADMASAIPAFQKVFHEEYINKHENKEFAKLVKSPKVGCLICHQGKKDKKNRNRFGEPLSELLDKKKDIKEFAKIKSALAKVAEMHVDPKDDKSPTFGELIAKGELPGGKLEDLTKEPEKKP